MKRLHRLRKLLTLATALHQPEGLRGIDFAFSKFSLTFRDRDLEQRYRSYRNAVIARSLPWLMGIIASLVLLSGAIDYLVFRDTGTLPVLLIVHIVVAAIILIGLGLLLVRKRPESLQIWIAGGLILIHGVSLVSTPLMEGNFVQYLGALPVEILLTFIVSGLMFRHARWIGGGAAIAYGFVIYEFYPSEPWAPIFYLAVLSVYAAYAAYIAERARREAWVEKEAYQTLLENVLPPVIAKRMQASEGRIADSHDDACVLFADIVGFTSMSETMPPHEVVELLNEIFTRFDQITEALDLEKIKTIGDCYMVAGGLPDDRPRDPQRIALAALQMQEVVDEISDREGRDLRIRAGVHTGPVVAGVIGERKFVYDLWGDTVNTASRLESSAAPGTVLISPQLKQELGPAFATEFVDTIRMKGKAEGMAVWQLNGHRTGEL